MSATPLLIGPAEREALQALRELAAASPIDMSILLKVIGTESGKAAHMRQMSEQTVCLPTNFFVTFSIEHGHPVGTCRHMSMSVGSKELVPRLEAIWMVAKELGFVDSLESCKVWIESLQGHGNAVNVVQLVAFQGGGSA